MLQFMLLLFIAFRFFLFYFLSHWTCLRNVNIEGIWNSRLAIKQLLIHIYMHVLCSATALISNCIYNFNLIISHARLIKISAVRVAGANAELHSLRWSSPVPSRHSPVVSPERSQLIFGSTLLLSTLFTPSHSHSHSPSDCAGSGWVLVVLVAFAAYWTIVGALQFICKAYPKMLMGLLYVVLECWTAGGIPTYLYLSLSLHLCVSVWVFIFLMSRIALCFA